ncbi:MAG: ankyrin repeat domain-containing protein, partial [Gammaproteobacteria bacterium]
MPITGPQKQLLKAINNNNKNAVQQLLIENKKILNWPRDKETNIFAPLLSATEKGYLEIIKMLVVNGASLDEKDEYGRTALHIAASNNRYDIVKLLLEHGIPLDKKDNFGRTALHWAASKDGLKIVKLLLEKNASLNEKDEDGLTALHLAANRSCIGIIKLLLEQGTILDMKNNADSAALIGALIEALTGEHWRIVYYLALRFTSFDNLGRQLFNFNFFNCQDKKEALKKWVFDKHNVILHFTPFNDLINVQQLKPESAIALAKLLLAGDAQALTNALLALKSETTQQIDVSQTWLHQEQLSQLIEAIKQNKQLQKLLLAPCQETLLTPEDAYYLQARFSLLPRLIECKEDKTQLEAVLKKDYAGLLNGLGWQVLSEMLKEVQPAYCGLLSTIKEKIALNNVLAASKAQSKVQQDFAAREQGLLTSLQEITQIGQADYLQLLEDFWRCVHRLRDLISDKSPHVWSAGRSLILTDRYDKVLLNAYEIASPASLLDEGELNRLFVVSRQEGDKAVKKVAKPVLFKKLKGQIRELERVEKQIGASCEKLKRDLSESAANLSSAKQEVLKYLAGIREGYQTYQKLIEGIVISQLKDYAFPRAY